MRRFVKSCAAMGLAGSAVLTGACELAKSKNPLSPTVAGPIPGVVISVPKLLEPASGREIEVTRQPIELIIENATTTGQRPLTYTFEVATDVDFRGLVFIREGVPPGDGGRTSVRLPDPLASGRTYYWRAHARDGANTGPYPAPANFSVMTPVVIEAPTPLSPIGGVTASSVSPTFTVRNAARSGPVGPTLSYVFEISSNNTFTAMIAIVTVPERPVETFFTLAQALPYSTSVFWRVKAHDGTVHGPWSATQSFRTPAAPPPPPPPPPAPTPTPSPSPSPPSGGGPYGPQRTIDIKEAFDIIVRVHDTLGYDLGSGSTRDSRVAFFFTAVAVVHYGHARFNPAGGDRNWCVKDAGGGRPPSDDVIVRCDTRDAWDLIGGAGANGYRFHIDYIGRLPSEQNVYPPPVSSLPR